MRDDVHPPTLRSTPERINRSGNFAGMVGVCPKTVAKINDLDVRFGPARTQQILLQVVKLAAAIAPTRHQERGDDRLIRPMG
jgi:hypothetical protein